MTKITDTELASRLRQNILNVLDLWASKDEQLKYQDNVPIADVTSELFNQWADDFYYTDTIHFKMAFNEQEREILADFDKLLNHIADNRPNNLPYIKEFVQTNDWILLNQAAKDIIKRIKNTAANTRL